MTVWAWAEFAAAYAVFLLSHVLPARPAARRKLAAALGERGYQIAYGVVSLAALTWLISAADRAPYVWLWSPAAWQVWLANLAMPLACLLIGFAVGAPNPLSFGGRPDGFDPRRPGVAGIARHPLLIALALWASVHAIANGDLAHLTLFGGFAAFALSGMRALDRRRRRQLGDAEWSKLAACTSDWPLAPLVDGRWRPRPAPPDAARLALGLLIWLALLALHPFVIGVSPLPPY